MNVHTQLPQLATLVKFLILMIIVPDAAICHGTSNVGSTVATLSWMQPSHINGILKQYEVQTMHSYITTYCT